MVASVQQALKEGVLGSPPHFPNEAFKHSQGVGMTSQRPRDRLIERLIELGITHPDVLQVMRVTPRHLFIDEALASRAYEDTALPIGFGQTISQPWVVAKMSEFLFANGRLNKVLEVGTGSGYQTAILAQLADEVFTVERIEPLLDRAERVLKRLDLQNIHFQLSDGHWGWPGCREACFDGIISAAAPESMPEALVDQLKVGGRLVMPIGSLERQQLVGLKKTARGVETTLLGEVLFVPMVQGLASDKGTVKGDDFV